MVERIAVELAEADRALDAMRGADTTSEFRSAIGKYQAATSAILRIVTEPGYREHVENVLASIHAHALFGLQDWRIEARETEPLAPYELRFDRGPHRSAILLCAEYVRLLRGLLAQAAGT